MSRVIEDGFFTKVEALDEPGFGGACHKFEISRATALRKKKNIDFKLSLIHFQDGPIKEEGVNGCHNEDLIKIVIDRLEAFQSGKYKCSENDRAIKHLNLALQTLQIRTQKRRDKGIEGTAKVK